MEYGPVIERLLEAGALSPDTLATLSLTEGQTAEEVLFDAETVPPDVLLAALSRSTGVRAIYLSDESIEEDARSLLPADMITNCQMLPLRRDGGRLVLAMADPSDVVSEDFARFVTGFDIERVAVFSFDLKRYLNGGGKDGLPAHAISEEELLSLPVLQELDDGKEEKFSEATPGPVIRAVQAVLAEGVHQRASDIHFEPNGRGLRVRYRIDGYLKEVAELPRTIQSMVLSRLKLSAGLDITERRRPQDGRTRLQVGDKSVDFRVSTLPTYFGEKIVMRILDNRKGKVDIGESGMLDTDMRTFLDFIRMPLGIVLITGPTGSGKTTSLYGALTKIHTPDMNIVTVEDPIEYQISGINQVQVNVKAGLTFAAALRSILRQDPDVVMVGEIRDLETASIAFESAMTGHMVFSTLHTNDAPSAITRLLHLGVPKYLVASSLLGVVAQRLVRRICPGCRVETSLADDKREILLRSGLTRLPERFYKGTGCHQCGNTGFTGRSGLFEIVRVTDAIRDLIFSEASEQEIRAVARRQGTHILLEDGLTKCEKGITTIDEVLHVAPAGLEAGIVDGGAQPPLETVAASRPQADTPRAHDGASRGAQPPLPSGASESVSPDGQVRDRILVIDADPLQAAETGALLTRECFEVTTAENVVTGLGLALDLVPDLIVVEDSGEPPEGLELVRKMRARPALRQIPVIVLSHAGNEENEARALNAGADDYLPHPLEAERLVRRVESHLRRARARRRVS